MNMFYITKILFYYLSVGIIIFYRQNIFNLRRSND